MSELRVETYLMPAARLGAESPLPSLAPRRREGGGWPVIYTGETNPEIIGNEHDGLPYLPQDEYDRRRCPRAFKVAVLENETLRAMFLLDLGGRLWSLVHKPTGRELLHKNPVFQPANLALRDAWFSGGVEWNIGVLGHTPFTCSPLFAMRLDGQGSGPTLRFHEWDRTRGVPWLVDFSLPDGSEFLLVRGRITNPHEKAIPMYWWSNIAVDETPDTRVLAPAIQARHHDYDGTLVLQDIPYGRGYDVSYSTNHQNAGDLYFAIPKGHRPWIAALDKTGRGLVHTSTSRLHGRKMFFWGQGPGGQHWQEFLAQPGHAYIEIQAGLCPTQGEYIRMPAGAAWEWMEAYGLMEADAEQVHGKDWAVAYSSVEAKLEKMLPQARQEEMLQHAAPTGDRPTELLHAGSGWGALERHRCELAGQDWFSRTALRFDDSSLGEAQMPWLALLQAGALPRRDVADEPGSPMIHAEWRVLLEASASTAAGNHWLTWYHLGIMYHYALQHEKAKEAWLKSIALTPNAWAYRNLAVLAADDEKWEESADLYLQSLALKPAFRPLAVETCKALNQVRRYAELSRQIALLPPHLQEQGRVKLLGAIAALEQDDLETVEAFFAEEPDVANVREGEVSISDLWFGMHQKKIARAEGIAIDDALKERVKRDFPPPSKFDFRMRTSGPSKEKRKHLKRKAGVA